MSRRRNEAPATACVPTDRFRRVLLGAVTALLVARPLAAGEDPGRLRALESTSGQTLNLLWLVVAATAAIWVTRSPRRLRVGPIAIALALVAALAAVSTLATSCYRHPAWLIVFEWLQLPVIFLVVRELSAADNPSDDSAGGLLAAMLASIVSIAAYAAYQAVAPAAGWMTPDLPQSAVASPTPSAEIFGFGELSATSRVIRGTLENADTFVALLLLILPAIGGYAFFGQGWRAKAAGLLLPLFAALLVFAVRSQVQGDSAAPRWTRLGIAADLSMQRPLGGVGPGNLDRHAPRFVVNTNPELLRDPPDSWVTLAATTGVPAALLLAGTIILAIRQVFRARTETSSSSEPRPMSPRWEFYLGGVGGLLLGLLLRSNDLPVAEDPRRLLHLGVAAGGRALVWFLAFALFDGLNWRGPARRFALAAGLAGVAMFGLISPAVLQPVIAQSFWTVAAISLFGAAEHVEPGSRNYRWLTIPVICGLAGAYFLLVWEPAYQGTSHLRDARRHGRLYPNQVFDFRTMSPGEQQRNAKSYRQRVEEKILQPLEAAVASDKSNVALMCELARWERQYWNDLNTDAVLEKKALAHIETAHALDPYGIDSLLTELHLRLTFTRLRLKYGATLPPKIDEAELQAQMNVHFQHAERLIVEIAKRAPAVENQLRWRLAQALINAKNEQRTKDAEQQARLVLELDQAPNLPWKLSPAQVAQARKWANLTKENN